jgi:hypothetical protein
MTLGP